MAAAGRPFELQRLHGMGEALYDEIVGAYVVTGALMLVAAYTPFTLMRAIKDGMWDYLGVVGAFGAIGVACYLVGRHLRHEATHWDFD